MQRIRTLKADEIEVRPQQVREGKASFLLYIDSRAAGTLLDETYGMENWNLEYKDVAGQIYGRLSVWDEEKGRYVYREDTGSESNIEAEKGMASDILKRLIVRFGVSELYSAPDIWIELGEKEQYQQNGKWVCGMKFKVNKIDYNEKREITSLEIVDKWGNIRFTYGDAKMKPAGFSVDDLKKFCRGKVNSGFDEIVTKKFYEYYEQKAESWKGAINFESLYGKWYQNNVS